MNGYKRINNNSLSQKESLGNVTAKTITTDTLNATTFLGQPSIWYTGLHGSIQSQFIELQFNYQGMFRVLNNVRNDYFRKS